MLANEDGISESRAWAPVREEVVNRGPLKKASFLIQIKIDGCRDSFSLNRLFRGLQRVMSQTGSDPSLGWSDAARVAGGTTGY